MTKRKIFPFVLYVIFTFSVGFIFALILPAAYLYSGEWLDTLSDALYGEEYEEAVKLFEGYYNKEVFYVDKVGTNGGLCMYETATVYQEVKESQDSEKEPETLTRIQKSYVLFLYGTQDVYNVYSTENNQTKVLLTVNGEQTVYEILNIDRNGDEKKDSVITYDEKGIIIVVIPQRLYPHVEVIEFIDASGETFYKMSSVDEMSSFGALDYSSQFFTDIEPFLTVFNGENPDEKALIEAQSKFLEISENYQKSTYETAAKRADKKATKTIIIYFVVVYVIADLLFTRFSIKFVKFLLYKVFKIKKKEKPMKVHNESFGNDYYSAVTMKLEVDEGLDFSDDITVCYGENGEVRFELKKEENYEKYLRLKAGTYDNLAVEILEGYKLEGIPSPLIVEGYRKTITAKIVRRED